MQGMAIGADTGIVIEAADYVLMHNSVEDVITATDLSWKSNQLESNRICVCNGV